MPSTNALSEKDANNTMKNANQAAAAETKKPEVKSLEYHRQVLKSKIEDEQYGHHNPAALLPGRPQATTLPLPAPVVTKLKEDEIQSLPGIPIADLNASGPNRTNQQYVSPSDNIMSPCTAKLTAFKSRQAGKVKPKSLFAQASAKKLDGENVFGAKTAGRDIAQPDNADNK
ncbi:hypothetical protein F5Y16DRAFT_394671 [Xylariaceae sp. FL0255]|nr:hypothetical protein F5Y16DRAFT_394671 [Xylariaceae sp. FL0255]